MSEKKEVNSPCDFYEPSEQLRQWLRSMSESDIMQMLAEWTENAEHSGKELPPETIMMFYDVLDEVAPLEPMPFDFQASWKRFIKEHPELIPQEEVVDTRKNGWSSPRKLKILVSLVAAALLCISAYAMDVPNVVYFWGRDVLQIQPASGEMDFKQPNNEGYTSFQDALQANGVNVDIPTWLPERFCLETITVSTQGKINHFTAEYKSQDKDERPIFIRVLGGETGSKFPSATYEKDVDSKYQTYDINGETIYVFTNEGLTHINWIVSSYAVDISGEFSEKELKQLLYSIRKD